jgi:hypothetical protein
VTADSDPARSGTSAPRFIDLDQCSVAPAARSLPIAPAEGIADAVKLRLIFWFCGTSSFVDA